MATDDRSTARFEREGVEFARAVTFYDAIYAFAVTLLITTVDDFSPEAWASLPALWDANGKSLTAFAISFAVVVSFWRGSHQAVAGLAAMNGRIIALSCLAMFGVVLIPFTTEAMGKLGDLPLPIAVYAVVIAATSIVHHIMEDQADLAGLREQRRTPGERRWHWAHAAILPVVFLLSIPVAFLVGPTVAQYCWISLLVLEPVLGGWIDRRKARAAGDDHREAGGCADPAAD